MVTSPCTGTCELNDGVCVDCNRTVEDIMRWADMSEAQRMRRMEELREE
jgi:predicted Fe-S protein YdhL (DUF1289 family)